MCHKICAQRVSTCPTFHTGGGGEIVQGKSIEKNKDGERWKLKKHHLGGQGTTNKGKGAGRTHVPSTSGFLCGAQIHFAGCSCGQTGAICQTSYIRFYVKAHFLQNKEFL